MTTSTAPSTNDLETALAHTRNLLARDPALAQEQALEILAVHPGHPEALRLRAASLRRLGRAQEALVLLDPMLRRWPHWPLVHSEIGQALAAAGQSAGAVAALEHAVKLDANLSEAWRALGDLHRLAGDIGKSDFAYGRHIATSVNDPRLREAAIALYDGKLAVAEPLLRTHLKAHPTDVAAIRMLAELAGRLGRFPDSENLLRRAVELAPGFTPARANLATVLQRQSKSAEALEVVEQLLEADAGNPSYLFLRSAALVHIGEFEKAIDTFEQVLGAYPRQSKGWMSYGHALKTVGRLDDSIAAYRRSLEIAPGLGEVWWSLANLKRFRFDETDIAAMKAALGRDDLGPEDRFHIEFALGKAEEDRGRAAESMAHYGEGNRLRREQIDYDADETTRSVDRARAFFTPDFYAAREGWGHPARDPIFVLGMPRAGSTLVEQILASHSRIEGTMELPDIPAMVRRVGGRGRDTKMPEILAGMSAEEIRALGQGYLDTTRVQRKTDRPYFVDKLPNNWLHIGLILLILPNATIIDARRHPLGCGFSNYKQHFARGQSFSYSMEDFGRYYRDYVGLIAHVERVRPGKVHRVLHEAMVDDTEAEIRRLLEHVGVPFEPACLRFWETERAVRTPSSEQVRQPIFRSGVEQWQTYEAWLDPMKSALGDVLDQYPAVPPSLWSDVTGP